MPLRAVILLSFLTISLPFCFFRPFYGILVWILLAFINPQSYTWTAFYAFPWAAAVAVPTVAGMAIFERRFGRLVTPLVGLLVLLWTWFTVTTIVSMQTPTLMHHAEDTWERWTFVSKVMLMAACIIPIVRSFERLRTLVLTIAGCFGFYVLKAVPFVIATGGTYRLYGPERSMLADNNDMGLALNMTLPIYFFLAQAEPNRWARRLFGFLCVLTIPAIFVTYSRGALVGFVAVMALMLLQTRRRAALLPAIAVAILLVAFLAPQAWKDRMNPSREGALDSSARSRLNSWAFARNLAADYPVTGGGFATFTEELHDRYSPAAVEEILGPHSVYFQVLGEHGYVGLAIYLALIAACFGISWRLRRQARARDDTQIALYAQMFQFCLVGFLSSGLFLGRAYFDYFFTIVACLAALRGIASDRWSAVPARAAVSDTLPAPALPRLVRTLPVPAAVAGVPGSGPRSLRLHKNVRLPHPVVRNGPAKGGQR